MRPIRRIHPIVAALLLMSVLLSGCGPGSEQTAMAKAMSARVDARPTYNESAKFLSGHLTKHDRDYVMWSMDYVSICLLSGNYDSAKAELLKCYADIRNRQDTDKEKMAAASNESLKVFKGEPFERAMVCTYLGMLNYMAGDYNNARIFCANADMEDATTEEDMKDYRHDFQIAHYWLGRSFMKLGQVDNARVAFQKAASHLPRKGQDKELSALQKAQAAERDRRMRLEKESYKRASSQNPPVPGATDVSASPAEAQMPQALPNAPAGDDPVLLAAKSPGEFFTVDYQQEVNLILMVETGVAPIKYLVGENRCMDAIVRGPYAERKVLVYLNGQKAGCAVPMLDMFHQADTRGTSEKDRLQLAKGVTQAVLSRMPYVGNVASYWNVQADHRYWHLLPGEVHVFAAKVKPGLYTVNLQSLDSNGNLLPRYSVTSYYLPVRDGQENIYLLHVSPEADNQLCATPKTALYSRPWSLRP